MRFGPDLAMSLNNLSIYLRDSGPLEDALAASREAVEIRRRRAQEHPALFAHDLTRSLANLSNLLRSAGDTAGAQIAIAEATNVAQSLGFKNINPASE